MGRNAAPHHTAKPAFVRRHPPWPPGIRRQCPAGPWPPAHVVPVSEAWATLPWKASTRTPRPRGCPPAKVLQKSGKLCQLRRVSHLSPPRQHRRGLATVSTLSAPGPVLFRPTARRPWEAPNTPTGDKPEWRMVTFRCPDPIPVPGAAMPTGISNQGRHHQGHARSHFCFLLFCSDYAAFTERKLATPTAWKRVHWTAAGVVGRLWKSTAQ